MRAFIQRVSKARVTSGGRVCGEIHRGLLVYVGVDIDDHEKDIAYVADKIHHLRIFPDDQGRMNRDVAQIGGQVLIVSAFTVQADARRGRRPTFDRAAPREEAVLHYNQLCHVLAETGVPVQRGAYGDDMEVQSTNDGPVCILLDSHRRF